MERLFENCIHGKNPACTESCPFHLDIRKVMKRVQKGRLDPAFNMLDDAVIFPDIVWRICPAPCMSSCKETSGAASIDLPEIEQALAGNAKARNITPYGLRPEEMKKIAIVGAGLSGLVVAIQLGISGYEVTVFEKSDCLGGWISEITGEECIRKEINRKIRNLNVSIRTNENITDISMLDSFDAVYITASAGLPANEDNRIFNGADRAVPIDAVILAKKESEEMIWFLKTGNLKPEEETNDGTGAVRSETYPEGGFTAWRKGDLSKDEAITEAKRCNLCDCDRCMKECAMMRGFRGTPRELARDIDASLNVVPHFGSRMGMRSIGSCNFCGLCKEICPVGIDLGEALKETRFSLGSAGNLPKVHHEYWLRDMNFAANEAGFYLKPSNGDISQIFFPGCQAAGSDQRYVSLVYEKLVETDPDTALLVGCCGAPALWAGEKELLESEHTKLRKIWNEAERPAFVISCPSCYRMFREYLPEIEVKIIYDALGPQCEKPSASDLGDAAIFDACSVRLFPEWHESVRKAAGRCGIRITELEKNKRFTQCCSYGGNIYSVNKKLTESQADEVIAQSSLPYITYCTNCRDVFAYRGKGTRHLLDIVLDINKEDRMPPTITERRHNRLQLRRILDSNYTEKTDKMSAITLYITDELKHQLSKDLILEDEITQTVRHCEESGNYLILGSSGHRVGHLKIGYVTYWAEYLPEGDGYRLCRAYSHRMTIPNDEDNTMRD